MPKAATLSHSISRETQATWRDYYEITKPRVVALLVLTALVGMCLSVPTAVPWQVLIPAMVGIAFLSSAAAAINHIVDKRIDSEMGRTFHRPLAEGRLSQTNAIIFAASLLLLVLLCFTLWLTH